MASGSAEYPWRRSHSDLDDDEVDAGSHSETDTEEYYNRCSTLSDETITDDGGGETATSSSSAAAVPAHPSSSVAWGWDGTGRRGYTGSASSARAAAVVSPSPTPIAVPEQHVAIVAAVPEVVVLQPMPVASATPNLSLVLPMASASRASLSGQSSGGGAQPAHGAAMAAGAGEKNPKKVYTCKRCGMVFWNPQALGGHVVGHINRDLADAAATADGGAVVPPGARRGGKPEKPHVCNECGAEFSTGVQLGGHKRKHWTGGPIVPKKKPRVVVQPLPPPAAEDVADLALALPVNAAVEAVERSPEPARRPAAAAGRVLLFGIDIGKGKQTPEEDEHSPIIRVKRSNQPLLSPHSSPIPFPLASAGRRPRAHAPPPLIDDAIAEVLLRLPPDEPEHLFRAALVCKPWLRVLCDPGFRRRYRVFHGAPPLLGLLHKRQVVQGDPPARFASTKSLPDFPHPGYDGRRTRPLDCRHGRVLVHMLEDEDVDLLVWDPVTGERHAVPDPGIDWLIYTAAVFCAADGCDHLDCHGGPFGVVFVATDDHDEIVKASAYSSETGVWTAPVSLGDGCKTYAQHRRQAIEEEGLAWFQRYTPYVLPMRGAVTGDGVYFTLRRGNDIIKYDLRNDRLSMINAPSHTAYDVSLMVMEDSSLGFACIEECCSLYLWSMKVNSKGVAEWVQRRVIELEAILPAADPDYKPVATFFASKKLFVAGSAEGVAVIFVSADAGLFTIDLKSEQAGKVDEPGVYFSVLPYMSFYTPDRGRLLSLATTH